MGFKSKLFLVLLLLLSLGMSFYRYNTETGQWESLEGLNPYGSAEALGDSISGYCNKGTWEISVSTKAVIEVPEFSFVKIAVPVTTNIEILPDGIFRIPTHQYAEWKIIVKISSTNPIDDVVIKDIFEPQLGVQDPPIYISQGTVNYTYSPGQMKKVTVIWTIGDSFSGDAELILKVYTKPNPAGNQEFTSPGTYYLNKGATLNYTLGGTGYSVTTEEILVTAYGEK
ncbi:hypothetical protein H5T89_07080 [bacterium]|nr:hypothetical protein [bacterium]